MHNAGSRAECAGRYSACATVATTARPYVTAVGPPAAVTTAARAQRRGADQADAGQDPLTAHPVGHRREQRRQQRRRSHARARDDADRYDATVAERHDGEPDHEGALARPHRTERELRAADRRARAQPRRASASSRGSSARDAATWRDYPRPAAPLYAVASALTGVCAR